MRYTVFWNMSDDVGKPWYQRGSAIETYSLAHHKNSSGMCLFFHSTQHSFINKKTIRWFQRFFAIKETGIAMVITTLLLWKATNIVFKCLNCTIIFLTQNQKQFFICKSFVDFVMNVEHLFEKQLGKMQKSCENGSVLTSFLLLSFFTISKDY